MDLLHKLRDEARYDSLPALTEAIAADVRQARAWFATTERHTSCSRI